MRINSQTLLKIAQDTVNRRTRADRSLLAAFLHGSVLSDQPVLGGTADIDLFFVHNDQVPERREIVRLTDEVHLDISHHHRSEFQYARELRTQPWIGHTLYGCRMLFDPKHFLDFTQASVRGHFHRADTVLKRVESQAEAGRQTWLQFYQERPAAGPDEIAQYLRAVEQAVNAIAGLVGPPLPERRLLLHFPARAEAAGRPGLHRGALGLLGAHNLDLETLLAWLPEWEAALEAANATPDCPPSLHPHRRFYYRLAIQAMVESDQPLACLWPLLRTWTRAIGHLPADAPELTGWQAACRKLELLEEQFEDRVAALDAYLDTVEETLESWGREHGA